MSHGTYVLFDDDAYVIGAVVVGEDAGSTSNFVYTISGTPTARATAPPTTSTPGPVPWLWTARRTS